MSTCSGRTSAWVRRGWSYRGCTPHQPYRRTGGPRDYRTSWSIRNSPQNCKSRSLTSIPNYTPHMTTELTISYRLMHPVLAALGSNKKTSNEPIAERVTANEPIATFKILESATLWPIRAIPILRSRLCLAIASPVVRRHLSSAACCRNLCSSWCVAAWEVVRWTCRCPCPWGRDRRCVWRAGWWCPAAPATSCTCGRCGKPPRVPAGWWRCGGASEDPRGGCPSWSGCSWRRCGTCWRGTSSSAWNGPQSACTGWS